MAGCHGHGHSKPERREGERRAALAAPSSLGRVVYPYSVVPGGVASEPEIEDAMSRDASVADHYSGVNVGTMVPVTLRSDTQGYVSFRKNGRIYWTSRKVHLLKGERVFSNGTDCIRGRCGNRISWKPRQPVVPHEFEEPTSAELNTAQIRGQLMEQMPESILGPLLPNPPLPNPTASIGAPAAMVGGGAAGGSATGGAAVGAPSGGGGGSTGTGVVTSQPNGGVPAVLLPPSGGPAVSPVAVPPAGPVLPGGSPAIPISISIGVTSGVAWIPGVQGTPANPQVVAPIWPGVPGSPMSPPVPYVPSRPGTPEIPSTPGTPPGPSGPPGVDSLPPVVHLTIQEIVPHAEVPEPSTMLLVGVGLVGAGVVRRSRTRVGR